MFVIKHRKIFVLISAIMVFLSLTSIFVFGLNPGIDFRGGALTEIEYIRERPSQQILKEKVEEVGLGSMVLQPSGDKGYLIKSRDLNQNEHSVLLRTLSLGDEYPFVEKNFNSIGPSVGEELSRKAALAILLSSLLVVIFIAFSFRKVSRPVSSWKYGIIAIAALLHDVLIIAGLFALISHYSGIEASSLFVVAALTIVGLSVSDTIVVFDRIRENLKEQEEKIKIEFKEVVARSLGQSYTRSILTSLTTILVLLSLFFFGPASTKYFALILTAGMFFGTYSSIFFASPILVMWNEARKKKVS